MTSRELAKHLVQLKNAISQHFSQSEWLELAALVDQFELVNSHPRLLRSMSFGDDDYEGHILSVLKTMAESDPDNLTTMTDYVRSRIPAEDEAGGEFISSQNPGGRKIVFSPSVFTVPDSEVENDLVSVMMPIRAEFTSVFNAIKGAATDSGMRCQRADDIWDHSTVIQDVFTLIFKSHVVVCDFSGKNPNVFYEAGIAHTLGKHVVPITQSADDVPFDLRHHRYLTYLNNAEGCGVLRSQLAERIKTLISQRAVYYSWESRGITPPPPPPPPPNFELMDEAAEILVRAAHAQGAHQGNVIVMQIKGTLSVQVGAGDYICHAGDRRVEAIYRDALEQLVNLGFVAQNSGPRWTVTNSGYRKADETAAKKVTKT